jgi:hypothetical protein
MTCDYNPVGNVAGGLLNSRGIAVTPEVHNALRVLFSPAEESDTDALERLVILSSELAQQCVLEIARGETHTVSFSPVLLDAGIAALNEVSIYFAEEGI